jgi:6-phosphogluconolactonase
VPIHARYPIIVVDNPAGLASRAARRFVTLARQAIGERGRFSVALSGGSTPRAMYRLLAQAPLKEQVDWQNVHLFLGDERFVPPDDPASSLRMARETLLDHVPVPAENIYAVPTEGLTPEAAAQRYARTLLGFFAPHSPRFDLILLGMGPDGHTASLFPGQPAVTSPGDRLVLAVHGAPKPPPMRITMTYELINQAMNVVFLVTGSDKARAVASVLAGEADPVRYPAAGVRPANGRVQWLLDHAAAENLGGNR